MIVDFSIVNDEDQSLIEHNFTLAFYLLGRWLGKKEAEMQKNKSDNKIEFEFNVRFQMKNYQLKYLTHKRSVIYIAVVILKILIWYFSYKP